MALITWTATNLTAGKDSLSYNMEAVRAVVGPAVPVVAAGCRQQRHDQEGPGRERRERVHSLTVLLRRGQ